jgi:uncharacterized protein YprB with RNaseH-like and TPR domain
VDLTSRLRSIVRPGSGGTGSADAAAGRTRELTYEPVSNGFEATVDVARIGEILGGRTVPTSFGDCLVIDRRYESDRWYGSVAIGDCSLDDNEALRLLDPSLDAVGPSRRIFIDLETTGLSGGAGTVAFLVGCGYFDLGAFQVRQFLLTSFAGERALLAAVADFFDATDLIVSYNGKTFDVPVMEMRWTFHRMSGPLDGVPHFDMLHPARRLWSGRETGRRAVDEGGCRLSTLERVLFDVTRVGDVGGFEIPSRFFRFLRSGDPRPLEPVLEHNRYDLVSLAAVTAHAARLAQAGADACRDHAEALALGRVYERAGKLDRAETCYARASEAESLAVAAEASYRLGLRCRRERRFEEAADCWRRILELTKKRGAPRKNDLSTLREFAAEALAIHHEHRVRDFDTAKELARFALDEVGGEQNRKKRADGIRHRLVRLDRKIAKASGQLFAWW